MVQDKDKLTIDKTRLRYNIHSVTSVKKSIYSNLTESIFRPFRYLKSYITFAQNTRVFETLLDCFTVLFLFGFFYLLFIFACAIDDQCAALYMLGGVQ
jgi:hypothetical protein